MDSIIPDLFVLLLIFLVSSLGSRWMMHRIGYPTPATLRSGQAVILILMKIILMTIWAIVLIVILWLLGVNPLHL